MSLETPPEQSLPPLGRPIRHRYGRRLFGVAALGAVLLWLAVKTDVRYYTVTSGSMEPTLRVGQRIAVDPNLRSPKVGEIIAFHPPVGSDPANPRCGLPGQGSGSSQACSVSVPGESRSVFIKRVIAGPGATFAMVNGHAVVDGVTEADPHVAACGTGAACNFPTPVRLTAGEYYVLGDNRGVSDDSRFWGPVPGTWIIGTVVRCSLLDTICHPVH
jgi:signal peptidase I